MELRRAERIEARTVAEIWLRSRQASFPAIPPQTHDDEEVRSWFEEVLLPNIEVWVAVTEDEIVALLVLEEDWVEQLYVAPDRLNQGIGSDLLALAKQLRPAGLQLRTFESNLAARRFYERHGFIAKETSTANEEQMPDVLYEWSGQQI